MQLDIIVIITSSLITYTSRDFFSVSADMLG